MGLKGAAYGWAAGAALDFYFKQKKAEKRNLFRLKNKIAYTVPDDVVDQMINDAELKKTQEALRLDYNEGIIWGRAHPIKAFFGWLFYPIIFSSLVNGIITWIIITAQNGYAVQHKTDELLYMGSGLEYAPNLPYVYWFTLTGLMIIGAWFSFEHTWPWMDNFLRTKVRFIHTLFSLLSGLILILWIICVIGFYIHW